MENKFFDKLLDQVIEEAAPLYLEKIEKEDKEVEDVKFSDTHNQKMKQLFKTVKRDENRKVVMKITKKVAIIVLCAILITGGLITSVEAWREEVVKFIMKNNDDNYMSINFGDISQVYSGDLEDESGDSNTTNSYTADEIKFNYLPEGFEVASDREKNLAHFCNFKNEDSFIYLKKEMLGDISKQADIENTSNTKMIFEDKEVFKVIKDNRVCYVWYEGDYLYEVTSNIEDVEILKFIENIKILKNF